MNNKITLILLQCLSLGNAYGARIVEIVNESSFDAAFTNTVSWQKSSFQVKKGMRIPTDVYIGWQEASGKKINERFEFLAGSGESFDSGYIQETSYLNMSAAEVLGLTSALVITGSVLTLGFAAGAAGALAGGAVAMALAENKRVRLVGITQRTTAALVKLEEARIIQRFGIEGLQSETRKFYDPVYFEVSKEQDTFRLTIKDAGPDELGPIRPLFQLERA